VQSMRSAEETYLLLWERYTSRASHPFVAFALPAHTCVGASAPNPLSPRTDRDRGRWSTGGNYQNTVQTRWLGGSHRRTM
jgi:hypothetical protein